MYLSEPKGKLKLNCKIPLKKIVQGSEQAQFLSCINCNTVVAVVYSFPSGLKGAVNAMLIDDRDLMQGVSVVSPKLLNPTEKINRWNDVWFEVTVNE